MNKYDKPMMDTALIWAEQSWCKRNKVGAVISKNERIISNGYNGTISGANNNCEDEVNGELISKNTVVHAEVNAITFAAKYGISTQGCTIYVTLSPCIECAKLMIQSGITEVVYKKDYRINHGVEFLIENGILVRKISEENN